MYYICQSLTDVVWLQGEPNFYRKFPKSGSSVSIWFHILGNLGIDDQTFETFETFEIKTCIHVDSEVHVQY